MLRHVHLFACVDRHYCNSHLIDSVDHYKINQSLQATKYFSHSKLEIQGIAESPRSASANALIFI